MSEITYRIRLECVRMRAVVMLNGCSVFETWTGAGHSIEYALSPWVVRGSNRLVVSLGALPPDPDEPEPAFKVEMFRVPAQSPECWPSRRLLGYCWSDNEAPLAVGALRAVVDHAFHSVSNAGPWSFEKATPFTAEDREAVLAVAIELGRALGQRDVKALRAALGVKITEVALGLEMSRDTFEAQVLAELGDFLAEPDFHVTPVDTRALTLEPAAGGRVVAVRGAGGLPAIQGSAAGKLFTHSFTVSHLDRAWAIVR